MAIVRAGDLLATAAVPPDRRTTQFTPRALFIFTALVGCVLALVLLKGWGILVVVAGLTATWLNYRGACGRHGCWLA